MHDFLQQSEQHGLPRQPPAPGELEVDATDRRRFLQLLGASLALAGHGGCGLSQPKETIVPYVRAPEHLVPGQPLYYATAVTLGGYATGVLVESHQGRPTKIEGNPQHPASGSATDAQTQAAILSLYDPERSQVITHENVIGTWASFRAAMVSAQQRMEQTQGAGLRILTETVTSPTLAAQLERLLEAYPRATWHSYEPLHRDAAYQGAKMAFGEALQPRYDFTQADVIVSLDANFLADGAGHIRYARDFAARREPTSRSMNQLHLVESNYSITGSMADHRLAVRPSRIATMARHLARRLLGDSAADASPGELTGDEQAWLDRAAAALTEHRGRGVVIAGDGLSPAVQALVHAMNAALQNIGAAVEFTEPVAAKIDSQMKSLRELTAEMRSGKVELLIILGGNPAYNAPAGIDFAEALPQVGASVHLSLYRDETTAACDWHIPAAHELEAWSDARAYDGQATILQPLIEPLYDGKTAHEVLALLLGRPEQSSYDAVRAHWSDEFGGESFEQFWREALHDGVVPNTRFDAVDVSIADLDVLLEEADVPLGEAANGAAPQQRVEVLFQPDPAIHDGRFANNGWLQELPRPITTLTWDNAALVSPATARRFDLRDEQLIELTRGDRSITIAVLIVPGHADDCLTLHLGYGRTAGGSLANGAGVNVFPLRESKSPSFATGISLRPLAGRYPLATAQGHHRMEGRNLVRTQSAAPEEHAERDSAESGEHKSPHEELTIFESPSPAAADEYAWGMSINLNTCIGCSACVVACQAENNIPVVGKEEVMRGREMHWIRVDQYMQETPRGPQALHQPVACMHCENAPCEVVCPVAATVHSEEGLNEMVYNRCVGTRYCSNNCPYKVRRFNFLQYVDDETPVLKLLRNPDVTVRMRGVMEKCTYCVQRINAARIEAKKEGRRIADGEVVTACQQACPTQAIVFGDTADPDTKVSQAKARAGDYGLLTELNTQPRTTYLPRIE